MSENELTPIMPNEVEIYLNYAKDLGEITIDTNDLPTITIELTPDE